MPVDIYTSDSTITSCRRCGGEAVLHLTYLVKRKCSYVMCTGCYKQSCYFTKESPFNPAISYIKQAIEYWNKKLGSASIEI